MREDLEQILRPLLAAIRRDRESEDAVRRLDTSIGLIIREAKNNEERNALTNSIADAVAAFEKETGINMRMRSKERLSALHPAQKTGTQNALRWKGTKSQFCELCYALAASGVFDEDVNGITVCRILRDLVNIDVDDNMFYSTCQHIRMRLRQPRSYFLTQMADKAEKRMCEDDEGR